MAYMTFDQQVLSHLEFLQTQGLDVEDLDIGEGLVRCHSMDDEGRGRGEYAYKTQRNPMDNPDLVGLITWCRGREGATSTHSTYGLDEDGGVQPTKPVSRKFVVTPDVQYCCDVVARSQGFWDSAQPSGESKYLKNKGVSAYGLRFMSSSRGVAAVVPARNSAGAIKAVQFLNPDGTKRFPKGTTTKGLFHALQELVNGRDIGIAESYATAATCYELTGISTVCSFGSSNLSHLGKELRAKFPDSRIVFFADNDRHDETNSGVNYAKKAISEIGCNTSLLIPCFGDIPPSKEASDWNDLLRLRGRAEVVHQITTSV